MGLLWTFMGYSTVYTIFAGLGEVIGGAFLLFKRTRLIGSLIVIAIMSNVVMLNFAYDVPVKLFSTHLLLMAIFLTVPDIKRLSNLFFFNRAIAPEANVSLPFHNGIKTKPVLPHYEMVNDRAHPREQTQRSFIRAASSKKNLTKIKNVTAP